LVLLALVYDFEIVDDVETYRGVPYWRACRSCDQPSQAETDAANLLPNLERQLFDRRHRKRKVVPEKWLRKPQDGALD